MIARTLDEIWKSMLLFRQITEDNHWLWIGDTNASGYGTISYKNYPTLVHRISAHINLGLDLDDPKQLACHKLECTRHNCFNPDHLYVGDHKQNNTDTLKSGNHNMLRKTHCPQGHPYDEKNTWVGPRGNRYCKACILASTRKRRALARGN